MIDGEMIRETLYDEFIKPTYERKNFIGIEIEIPIVNLDKEPVNFDVVHEVTGKFNRQFKDFKNN